MQISRGKKIVLIVVSAIVVVLGAVVGIYFLNKDRIDNSLNLKFMDEEEYCNLITDRLTVLLQEGLFAPAGFAPDLSSGADIKAVVSVGDEIASLAGLPGKLEVTTTGTAFYRNGTLSASVEPAITTDKDVPLTQVDLTLDFPEKRAFVRIPEFDERTLELTSLYKRQLEAALADVSTIVDVEKVIGSLSETFGGSLSNGEFFDRLRASRKSTKKVTDQVYWGIGLKEGKECVMIESAYGLAGFNLRVRIYADDKGGVVGFDVLINTGKNRLGVLFDLTADKDGADFAAAFEATFDALKVLNGTVKASSSGKAEDGSGSIVIEAEPGKLLKSFIGGGETLVTADIGTTDSKTIKCGIGLKRNGEEAALVSLELTGLTESRPERLGTGEVTDISALNIMDYGDVGKLAEFVVDRIEKLDIQMLRDYVDLYIKTYVNESAGYDLVKEFWSLGMLETVVNVLVGKQSGGSTNPFEGLFGGNSGTPETEPGNTESTDAEALPADAGDEGEQPEVVAPAEGENETETSDAGQTEEKAGDTGKTAEDTADTADTGKTGASESDAGKAGAEPDKGQDAAEPGSLTPEEIEKKKAEFLSQYKYSFPIESDDPKADWGDVVVMDIIPLVMGMPMKDAEFKDANAYLGEQWYGEGLDEKIIGASVGDVLEVKATLGDQFGAFSGQKMTFRVTVTEIHKYIRPEWTESFIVDLLGYKSLDECEKKVTGVLD